MSYNVTFWPMLARAMLRLEATLDLPTPTKIQIKNKKKPLLINYVVCNFILIHNHAAEFQRGWNM